mmetsp:Transcript_48918/g.148895  ORF Transcript_48918/g.148895 Transcript_48918/m.148895 type:complete len:350 (-) Transcript_48918:1525-2574(-)
MPEPQWWNAPASGSWAAASSALAAGASAALASAVAGTVAGHPAEAPAGAPAQAAAAARFARQLERNVRACRPARCRRRPPTGASWQRCQSCPQCRRRSSWHQRNPRTAGPATCRHLAGHPSCPNSCCPNLPSCPKNPPSCPNFPPSSPTRPTCRRRRRCPFCPISCRPCPTTFPPCPTSCHRCPTSCHRCPTSCHHCPTSCHRCPTSCHPCPTSSLHPTCRRLPTFCCHRFPTCRRLRRSIYPSGRRPNYFSVFPPPPSSAIRFGTHRARRLATLATLPWHLAARTSRAAASRRPPISCRPLSSGSRPGRRRPGTLMCRSGQRAPWPHRRGLRGGPAWRPHPRCRYNPT